MPTFTTVRETPAAPREVFAYVTTLENWTAFRGFGPLPGIAQASVPEGTPLGLGVAVRVTNTDGSVHHERITTFEPPHRYAVRMTLAPPASSLMAWIDEDVAIEATAAGSRVRRRFETRPRAWWTAPAVWLVTFLLLRPAVRRHDRAVAAALSRR